MATDRPEPSRLMKGPPVNTMKLPDISYLTDGVMLALEGCTCNPVIHMVDDTHVSILHDTNCVRLVALKAEHN